MEFVTFGKEEFKKELFKFDHRDRWITNKPNGGLWASPLRYNDEFLSAWEEWCIREEFMISSLEKYIQFKLKENAKILTIDSTAAYIKIMESYRQMTIDKYSLDFEKISKDFDAVLLTENASIEMHLGLLYSNGNYNYRDFNAWDVESIVILNFDAIDLDSCICKTNKNYERYKEEYKEILSYGF